MGLKLGLRLAWLSVGRYFCNSHFLVDADSSAAESFGRSHNVRGPRELGFGSCFVAAVHGRGLLEDWVARLGLGEEGAHRRLVNCGGGAFGVGSEHAPGQVCVGPARVLLL